MAETVKKKKTSGGISLKEYLSKTLRQQISDIATRKAVAEEQRPKFKYKVQEKKRLLPIGAKERFAATAVQADIIAKNEAQSEAGYARRKALKEALKIKKKIKQGGLK